MSEGPSSDESNGHARLRRRLCDFWPAGAERIKSRTAGLAAPAAEHPQHRELSALAAAFPHEVLLLDLETCGFAGSMVFLIGLLWFLEDGFVVDQLLARNYAEEQSILETMCEVAAGKHVLVTFNGKSFDWPMLNDRSRRYRMAPQAVRAELGATPAQAFSLPDMLHCDLLHHARRRWKAVLPDCRLQTLERYICRRHRSDDIPGYCIPPAYHDFVRSGDMRQLRSVLHHNALDLVTLLEIALELSQSPLEEEPGQQSP